MKTNNKGAWAKLGFQEKIRVGFQPQAQRSKSELGVGVNKTRDDEGESTSGPWLLSPIRIQGKVQCNTMNMCYEPATKTHVTKMNGY